MFDLKGQRLLHGSEPQLRDIDSPIAAARVLLHPSEDEVNVVVRGVAMDGGDPAQPPDARFLLEANNRGVR